jgi:hypothetical protein
MICPICKTENKITKPSGCSNCGTTLSPNPAEIEAKREEEAKKKAAEEEAKKNEVKTVDIKTNETKNTAIKGKGK